MYVREIRIKKFRHLTDVTLGPFAQPPEHSDLIALAGPNAGGKSSVLELLTYALSNSWSLAYQQSRTMSSNSFEVAIAITPNELELVREYVTESGSEYAPDVASYLDQSGTYYRAYNFADGNYQARSALYNQIHDLVTRSLRNHYHRSLGFFLKSDRSYPAKSFNRNRIFEYESMTKLDHIWSMAYNTSELQYADMFDFLVQQRYHYFQRLGSYHHKLNEGSPSEPMPTDPLQPYDELLQRLFADYQFANATEDVPTNLFVRIPAGEVVPFGDLSSGEKEVFFLLAFFLRHDVTNAVIVIDEPELHLHPELARTLVRTMQSIKKGNQVWIATHNSEIIDEAGRDRVFYLARDPETQTSVVVPGTDEAEAARQLKDLFGYSGYIGIARSLVFLEGTDSSSDRKMFSALFPEYGSKVKFVPSGSNAHLPRINAAVLSILEQGIGAMQFYLIRDRDYLTDAYVIELGGHGSGRVAVLARHEIENYLLDYDLIAKVQTEIFARPTTADQVRDELRAIAKRMSTNVLRDMVQYRLNLRFGPADFSIGAYMRGEETLDDDGQWIPAKTNAMTARFVEKAQEVADALSGSTSNPAIGELVLMCQSEVKAALDGEDDGWRILFPGKELIDAYASQQGLGRRPAFHNSLIKELSTNPDHIPPELARIIEVIAEGNAFVD